MLSVPGRLQQARYTSRYKRDMAYFEVEVEAEAAATREEPHG
ncbi:hypothetical protein [Streptomyces sp. NPDC018031]